MIQDFLIPFFTIGLAELGDKTQIAILCLATQTRKHFFLLGGIVLAFLITDGIAVILGNFVTNLIPEKYIKIVGGIIFIVFGVITLLNKKEEETKCELKNPFLTGFGIIFVSELGDKTQIAAGLFATKFQPVLVLLGVIFALAILSLMAIYLGKLIMEKINRRVISYIAGGVFIIIGIIYLFKNI
ncbi:MAG: TMEM165/GDT1 family protein [bacterium]